MQDEPRGLNRDIIVIGASAGGLSALRELLRELPADLPAAVFVVLHISPDSPSLLPQILGRAGVLPAALAVDREAIVRGRIYIAPPDHHLILKRAHVRVTRGPKENGFRPAVDPLFRTAARAYGPRVIAVVLSGGLNDGTHGLGLVTAAGGVALVQDPEDAMIASMPLAAMQAVEVHHVLPARELGAAIVRRVLEPIDGAASAGHDRTDRTDRTDQSDESDSSDVAEAGSSLETSTPDGEPSLYSCPECGGGLWEATDDKTRLLRFSCHVGHAYTAEVLAALKDQRLDNALWTALRALEEHAALYRRMTARTAAANLPDLARRYQAQVTNSEAQAAMIRDVITTKNSLEEPNR